MEKQKLFDLFAHAVKTGTLSHAYILEGTKNSEKEKLAYSLAQKLTPYSEDITVIGNDGKTVKDEAVLNLQERLSLKPMVGELNVGIIEDADTMTIRAQNRLLKTLEEPKGGAVIFLLSENRENLLQTILSRCVVRRIDEDCDVEELPISELQEQAAIVGEMLLEQKPFYSFSKILDIVVKERETALRFLEALEEWYRDVLLQGTLGEEQSTFGQDERIERWANMLNPQKGYAAVMLIEEAKNDLLRNINPGYTIKNLILKI